VRVGLAAGAGGGGWRETAATTDSQARPHDLTPTPSPCHARTDRPAPPAPAEIGACHFLETVAFKGTARRSGEEVQRAAQAAGIATSAVFNREVLMYKVDTLRSSLGPALELLAECSLTPSFSSGDLDEARTTIAFQREEARSQPQLLVSEQLYAAAYGPDSPLGRPEKCPEGRINAITGALLRGYTGRHFVAPRMVLSGVGVDHAALVDAARRLFGGLPPGGAAPPPRPTALLAPGAGGQPLYTGGDVRSAPDWGSMPATVSAATAKTEFTHFMLAFPTVGWAHDDVVPVCVVDTLLGGGSSFSAGGPGKGMYSRLYREVLNAYGWVESANAFSAQLYDSGLVGIYGSAPPEHAGGLVRIAASHLARLVDVPVKGGELARARNQLASSVLMNLETRGLLAEDIGRQVLSHGKRLDPSELVRRIQAVTPEDVSRVMRAALAHPPSFAAVGEGASLPDYATLASFFAGARAGAVGAAHSAHVHRLSAASAAAARTPAGAHTAAVLQGHAHAQQAQALQQQHAAASRDGAHRRQFSSVSSSSDGGGTTGAAAAAAVSEGRAAAEGGGAGAAAAGVLR
jgi:mitochondrial-processing peptidase subunit alpha